MEEYTNKTNTNNIRRRMTVLDTDLPSALSYRHILSLSLFLAEPVDTLKYNFGNTRQLLKFRSFF